MKSTRNLLSSSLSSTVNMVYNISSFFSPASRFNHDLSLHANFLAMCSSFRIYPTLSSVSAQFDALANELKNWELHFNLNRFLSLSLDEIKKDKQILKAIIHDIAVIEMAKMAIHKWCLQCENNDNNKQALLIQRYRTEIQHKQKHLHRLYQKVDELQWQPEGPRDCYFSTHLWLTEQGLNILRASLDGTDLKSDFSRLENEIEELLYRGRPVGSFAPSLHQ